ncbi:MAG: hypothetical protein LBC75_08065 [Fibromonadaceae bacterium]|jgi:uncharacterized protein (TIGR02145 family)|nr:hypothetical protein [Fibromonadaceae bacterium]
MKPFFLLASVLILISCATPERDNPYDPDGINYIGGKGNDIANYKIVQIGEQVWMAENLNYNVTGSLCYDNVPANCKKYGRLYDFGTAMTVCPDGWHLSSSEDWDKLISYVENNNGCSNCAWKHLKATNGWNGNGNGQNTYGFSALPGGYRFQSNFTNVGNYGSWWSSKNSIFIAYDDGNAGSQSSTGITFQSVRCVKD